MVAVVVVVVCEAAVDKLSPLVLLEFFFRFFLFYYLPLQDPN